MNWQTAELRRFFNPMQKNLSTFCTNNKTETSFRGRLDKLNSHMYVFVYVGAVSNFFRETRNIFHLLEMIFFPLFCSHTGNSKQMILILRFSNTMNIKKEWKISYVKPWEHRNQDLVIINDTWVITFITYTWQIKGASLGILIYRFCYFIQGLL